VETTIVDADYRDTDPVEYIGQVVYEDDEFAEENGLVQIDPYTEELTTTEETV